MKFIHGLNRRMVIAKIKQRATDQGEDSSKRHQEAIKKTRKIENK